MRISLQDASALAERALRALGYVEDDARAIADHLIDCELRGLEYSGLARVLSIKERLDENPAGPNPMVVTRESPVSAQVDGGDQIGYLVAAEATRIAISKARDSGLAAVGANRTWYTGMLSYYAERITGAGMVAIIASNATPWVAPVGGTQAMFGTNPICLGFPSLGIPLIWDIGISEIIHAQAVIAHRTGASLQTGVAYDPEGHPTTDPLAALSGAFVNWGGHRGSGLGIAIQLLGALAGSPVQPGPLRDFGFFVVAIQPELFANHQDFEHKVTEYMDLLHSSRPLDPQRPVRVPFERSAALRASRIADGAIDVDTSIHSAVLEIASVA